jgi:hypothetical protein
MASTQNLLEKILISKSSLQELADYIQDHSTRLPYSHSKNHKIIATFNDNAFQASLKFYQPNNSDNADENKQDYINDPLPVQLFQPYGYMCQPAVGVYSNEYEPILPLINLILQETWFNSYHPQQDDNNITNITHSKLINDIKSTLLSLRSKHNLSADQPVHSSSYILLHSTPNFSPCQHFQCPSDSEINLILHPFRFPSAGKDANSTIFCGVYGRINISGAHLDGNQIKSALDKGCPLDCIEERAISIHSQRFSPCNNHISIDSKASSSAFYAVSMFYDENSKTLNVCVSFHVILNNSQREEVVTTAIGESQTVADLLVKLLTVKYNSRDSSWERIMREMVELIDLQSIRVSKHHHKHSVDHDRLESAVS